MFGWEGGALVVWAVLLDRSRGGGVNKVDLRGSNELIATVVAGTRAHNYVVIRDEGNDSES